MRGGGARRGRRVRLREHDESRMRGIRQGSGISPPDGRTPRPARSVSGPPHGATNLPDETGPSTVGTPDRLRIVGDTPPKRSGLPVRPPPPARPGMRPGAAPMRPYANRAEAGALVAAALVERQRERVVVAALPRGGVGVAVPIARMLGAPLTLSFARKLALARVAELAVGAVDEDGQVMTDASTLAALGASL